MHPAVVDGLVNNAVVEIIIQALGEGETVAIYGTAVHSALLSTSD
jgi:hypothetical protein